MGNFGGRLWRAGFKGLWHRPWSHCAARVQRVQRVLPALGRRVQRVVVSPLRGDEVLYAAPRQNQNNRACGDISPRGGDFSDAIL